ncbi:hypothetical protein QQS21_004206 [Conoideocrella luteorostrata]|uniref:Major facilitator superfamily (MFS) profile domain-containing protein n=1 Tax=Conoideocrella luteorostrata TaxID=1105319 RepID=A0AAJ0FVP7_9HYPO|nr:hypothetical protein QQS21_004206 [Conoideocrella luteorostrata]
MTSTDTWHDVSRLDMSDTDSHHLESESETKEPETEYLTGTRLWLMLTSLVFSIFLIALDMTIVATSLPAITNEFHGLKDAGWYGAIYLMTSGGFQSTWGKTYQYFPLKISFLIAIFVFLGGSLLCGAAPNSAAFIVGRTIAGIGAAGVSSGAYTICAYISEPSKRAAYTGILGAVFGVGSVLGPLLGGVFSTETSWRWCFYINLPIGVLPLLATVFFFQAPEAARPRQAPLREKLLQLDPPGTAVLMGAILTYLVAVQHGGVDESWGSGLVVGLLEASVALFFVFGLVEYWQGERAMIIPRLFLQREIGVALFYTVFQGGALFSIVYYLPIYFQAVRGDSPVISGVHNLPFIIAAMTSALGAGIFISKTGLSTLVMVAGSAIATLGCGLCYLFGLDTSVGLWVGVQIVAGIGLGGAFQVPIIVGQSAVLASDLPAITAMMLCFQTIGGAIWVSATQSVFTNRMLVSLPSLAPGVGPTQVISAGAGQLRSVFGSDQLPGVVAAYLEGIKASYALACAVVGASLFIAVFLPWQKLDAAALKQAGGAL